MSARLLVFLVFVEGFASLGIEVIALRRLVPHVGSAITVTAPTIALFLLALTIGYWTGGRIKSGFGARVQANFLIAAGLAGVGLSTIFVQGLFAAIPNSGLAFLLFIAVVVCPPACLLAQTVPLMANLIEHERAGAASAVALTASTAGSVLGALIISLGVMQLAGVSAAVALCCAALCLAAVIHALANRRSILAAAAAMASAPLVAWNVGSPSLNTLESAYADYRVTTRSARPLGPDYSDPARVFLVNNQQASLLDASEPPKRSPYIERMQRLLLDELGFSGKQVLVLGAGGFTLSVGDTSNRYTYVDIDPHIRSIAERQFIRGPINGRFVVEDARRFVARTQERFDAVVVDVYTSSNAIPGHLLTAEFWRTTRRVLSTDGVVMANLVLDPGLRSVFAHNVLATIEQELGRCAVEVLQRQWAASNVVVTCLPAQQGPRRARPYTDERSSADLDRAMGFDKASCPVGSVSCLRQGYHTVEEAAEAANAGPPLCARCFIWGGSVDQVPSHPRKRVRMKCAFGHLSVAAAAADGRQLDEEHHGRQDRGYGDVATCEQHPDHTSGVALTHEQPMVTVRRRSRLAAPEATA